MRDLEVMPLRKLVDLALASDRMTAGRYLHEIKRRLPMLEAAVGHAEAADNLMEIFLKHGERFAETLDAYRAAREDTREIAE